MKQLYTFSEIDLLRADQPAGAPETKAFDNARSQICDYAEAHHDVVPDYVLTMMQDDDNQLDDIVNKYAETDLLFDEQGNLYERW